MGNGGVYKKKADKHVILVVFDVSTEVFACANTNMASFFRFKAYRFVNFYQENGNFYSACENSKSTATDYLEFSNDFGKVDIFVV